MPLESDRLILREERADDMEFLLGLRNDLTTQAWSKTLPPDYTEPMYRKRFEAREFSFDRADGRFVILLKESGERAGTISYSNVESRHSATVGIMMAQKFWGGGYALEAQEVLLKFLFVELGLRVVRLWTHSGNPRAVKLAEKSGFQVSARQRESIFKDGRLFDNLSMDLLREEYFAQRTEMVDGLSADGLAADDSG